MREAKKADVKAMDVDTLIAWTATNGLLNYRLGNASLARDHYRIAIESAELRGKHIMATMAALHWALAALESGDEHATPLREDALARAARFPVPPVLALVARLELAVDNNAEHRPPPRH